MRPGQYLQILYSEALPSCSLKRYNVIITESEEYSNTRGLFAYSTKTAAICNQGRMNDWQVTPRAVRGRSSFSPQQLVNQLQDQKRVPTREIAMLQEIQ